jgi:hypothetical protein
MELVRDIFQESVRLPPAHLLNLTVQVTEQIQGICATCSQGVSADVRDLDAPYTRVSQADYCTMHLVRNVSRYDVPTFGTVKVLQEKCIPIRRVVLNVQKAADQCFHWAQERFSVSMVMDT